MICHVFDILHTAYFVAAELHALVKMSRKGPEFDEEMRVRPLNPAILSGATDIIAVRHKDGTFRHSAFHVRFGWRSGVFRGGNVVEVLIDGKKTNKKMKIGSSGVAYFPDESDEDKIIRDLDAAKEVFTIKFLPKITLWGKDVTKFISKFLKVEIQTQLHVWDHTDKVIISDIDGTITRSDGAGHLLFWARKWKLPILSSKNFTHAHVVDLLAAVSQRKYRIMYLTARNIGYASQVVHSFHIPQPPAQFRRQSCRVFFSDQSVHSRYFLREQRRQASAPRPSYYQPQWPRFRSVA